jgi:hypothetical protein
MKGANRSVFQFARSRRVSLIPLLLISDIKTKANQAQLLNQCSHNPSNSLQIIQDLNPIWICRLMSSQPLK